MSHSSFVALPKDQSGWGRHRADTRPPASGRGWAPQQGPRTNDQGPRTEPAATVADRRPGLARPDAAGALEGRGRGARTARTSGDFVDPLLYRAVLLRGPQPHRHGRHEA